MVQKIAVDNFICRPPSVCYNRNMKNKFLFLIPLALIFLVYAGVSFAATPTVSVANMVGVGLTTANASGTVTNSGDNSTVGGAGFVVGTTSGTYTATSSRFDNGYATGTDFSWSITETGSGSASTTNATLNKGTVYYIKAYTSTTANGTVYSSTESSFLTGADAPTNLGKGSADQNSINLTWNKGTGANNTIIRYNTGSFPASITANNTGCTSDSSSCTIGGLACGTPFYFRAWSSTTAAGLSTSSASFSSAGDSAAACPTAGTSGGRTLTAPTTYSDSLVINGGAESTKTREVDLSLKANNALYVTISNDTLFLGSLENYSTTKKWILTEGDGLKTVYAKFVSLDGVNSDIISDTITLKTPEPAVPAVPATPATPATPAEPETKTPAVPATPAAPATPAVPAEKQISQMTKEELTAKIAEILISIQTLQTESTKLKTAVVFENNLKYGNKGDNVVKLQDALIKEGFLAIGLNTGWFGPATRAAVIKFQEKYADDILVPSGLTKGNGFVGARTRAKLNEILGK